MPVSPDQIFDRKQFESSADFLSGAVLLIDKPLEWTSFDVVNKIRSRIRYGLGIKKIKVGHAGTLDPLATGLLIVCTGKLTKEIDSLQAMIKKYSGTITLGATTPTCDSEFEPDAHFPTAHITPELIDQHRKSFIGTIEQVPPIYSAIKVNGQKAYQLARKGDEVEMKPRKIEIYDFEIASIEMPTLTFSCTCSKGTYIRSLARDFGLSLNSGAYLSSLRRESIGDFSVNDAFKIEEIVAFIDQSIATV